MQYPSRMIFRSGNALPLLLIAVLFLAAGCAGLSAPTPKQSPEARKGQEKNAAWLDEAKQAGEKAGEASQPDRDASGGSAAHSAADDTAVADRTGPPAPADSDDPGKDGQTPAAEGKTKTAAQEAAIQKEIDQALEYYAASQDFWQQGEFDNALHALDQAYQQIMTVDAAELPKFIQQKDDLRYMISKRILEIYASRHNTAKGNGHAIPREMNQHIRREVKFFTEGRGRSFFINAYKRSGRYRPYIVEQLKKAGLP